MTIFYAMRLRDCLKNRKYRLFLQPAANAALKSLAIERIPAFFAFYSPAVYEKFGNTSIYKQALVSFV